MAKVVIGARLPGRIDQILAGHEIVRPAEPEAELPRARLTEALRDAEGLLTLLKVRIDDALLDGAPRLRVVANYAVGYDNVDLAATARRGIVVTNTPDVLTDATADLTMTLMLAAARRLPEGGAMLREGRWRGWEPEQLPAMDLGGAQLGIVGLGRIGQAVARRARGFGMRVVYTQRSAATAEVEAATGARRVALDELVATSDVVTLHAPATAETRHLMDAARIAQMKPRAVLVNTARGALVDEAALAAALDRGHLLGVGLDVFEDEPRVHPALAASPRAVLMPHLGSSTVGTRTAMAELAAQSIADVLAGRRPANVVSAPGSH
ncbi:MAG: D-glycerate dehydrogenase [Myxococcales bacterium]|nr:D-glycerate dehydrogenase [Myxococcales bacterium]